MTDETEILTEIAEHILPYGRRVRLVNADYRNGLNMLRMIMREGKRITVVEIDPESANSLAADLATWAKDHAPDTAN